MALARKNGPPGPGNPPVRDRGVFPVLGQLYGHQGDTISEQSTRVQGVVKWFSADKCFGFIALAPDAEGNIVPDVFVHYRGIRGTGYRNLYEGQHVDFEIVKGEKGPQANDVLLINEDGTLSEVKASPKPSKLEEAA